MMLAVERNGEKTERLGNTRNLVAKVDNANWFSTWQQNKYKHLKAAKMLIPEYAVSSCMEFVIPGKVAEVWLDTDSGNAHLKGVARCGSVWTCPVCAPKIAIERRGELVEALERAEKVGFRPILVTLTASHTREMGAAELVQKMTEAKKWMRRHGSFGAVKEAIGYKGGVSALEDTWGFANGWHFHFHEVFLVSKVLDAETVKNEFFPLWERALERVGLTCDYEHGVDVIVPTPGNHEAIGQYIAKWGLEGELSGGVVKKGKTGNFSPFQLLGLYADDPAEYGWAGWLFQEHAKATKGKTSMRWSRGLRSMLGLDKPMTDKEAVEARASENSILLLALTRAEYKKIIYSGRPGVIGELLVVAGCGLEALLLWLESIFEIVPGGGT